MIEKLKAFLLLANYQIDDKHSNDTHVFFTAIQLHFIAEYDPSQDPTYFRMLLPDIDSIDNECKSKIFDIVMDINSRYKVGKIIVLDNRLWITVDNFIYGEWDVSPLFARDIAVARDMINDYRRMRNEQSEQQK